MKYVLYVLLGLVALLLVLLVIAVVRAMAIKKTMPVKKLFDKDFDKQDEYAAKLVSLLKHPTVAVKVGGEQKNFDAFLESFKKSFPNFIKQASSIEIQKATFYKLKGNSDKRPLLLMSHTDIVAGEGEWKFPPFGGVIDNGIIWGRGTMDTKGLLAAFMCALDDLCAQGKVFEQDVYVLSTHDEEVFGEGALNVRDYCLKNNLRFDTVIDEGGAVTEKVMPGIANDVAVIGLTEKGYMDVRFTALGKGGHSSTPPKNTPIARLSSMVHDFETHNYFKPRMIKPVVGMFKTVSPYMPFALRLLLGNQWLFGGLLKALLPKVSAQIGAMLKTSMVFTQAAGSTRPNVIPQTATVVANLRNLAGDSKDSVMETLSRVAAKYDVTVELETYKPESKIADEHGERYLQLRDCIANQFEGVVVTPYVMLAGADCCKLDDVGENIFRFSPIRCSKQQLGSVHATDENIGVRELAKAVEFFKYYLVQYK